MAVQVLAFFDTGFQGGTQRWRLLREHRPLSRRHGPLGYPSSLGAYDLADPSQAQAVIGMAAAAGLDGFVVPLAWRDGAYHSGAAPLAPFCRVGRFALAPRWRVQGDPLWAEETSAEDKRSLARALIGALADLPLCRAAGRPMLILDSVPRLAAAPGILALLRAGLPGLYVVVERENAVGLAALGIDAALDPGPSIWESCPPANQANGYAILEMRAGLRDTAELTDRFYPYPLFAFSRMLEREKRGKVFPRVLPGFQDWPAHQQGGATILETAGGLDPHAFGQFLENAIAWTHRVLPPGERFVFLDSWNNWFEGSQIEPSELDGDLIYNAARQAIDRGRYIVRTEEEGENP